MDTLLQSCFTVCQTGNWKGLELFENYLDTTIWIDLDFKMIPTYFVYYFHRRLYLMFLSITCFIAAILQHAAKSYSEILARSLGFRIAYDFDSIVIFIFAIYNFVKKNVILEVSKRNVSPLNLWRRRAVDCMYLHCSAGRIAYCMSSHDV